MRSQQVAESSVAARQDSDDLAQIPATWSSAGFGRWNQILDNVQLAVGQICWVPLPLHKHNVYHDGADSR